MNGYSTHFTDALEAVGETNVAFLADYREPVIAGSKRANLMLAKRIIEIGLKAADVAEFLNNEGNTQLAEAMSIATEICQHVSKLIGDR